MAIKVEELQVLISANADQFKNELVSIKNSLNSLQSTTSKVTAQTGGMTGSFFRSNIATLAVIEGFRLLAKGVQAVKTEITDASSISKEFETAIIGLQTVAGRKIGGNAIPEATQAMKDLSSDGLLPLKDSATGLKNLLASGFNLEQSVNLMKTFKDSASFGRQSALTFGQAVSTATEGIKNGNSILVDNAGITKNLSVILKEAGKSQQDLMLVASDASVRQALYNGLLKEGNLFEGDAIKLLNTRAGMLAYIGTTFKNLQNTIGSSFSQVELVILQGISTFLNGLSTSVGGAEAQIHDFANRVAGFFVFLIRVIGTVLSKLPLIGKNFEAMANFTVKPVQAQNALADSVNNAGGAMDNATKSAKELNKELASLASFDEMNVLTPPANSAGAGGAGGGSGISTPSLGGSGGGSMGLSAEDVKAINDYAKEFQKSFDDMMTPINNAIEAIKKFYRENKQLIDTLVTIALIIGGVILVVSILTPIVTSVIAVFTALGAVITFLVTNPIGMIILAVGSVIALFITLYNTSSVFKDFVDNSLIPALKSVGEFFISAFVSTIQRIQDIWNNVLKPILQTLWDIVTGLTIPMLKNLGAIWSLIFNQIKDKVKEVWNSILTFIQPVLQWMNDNIVSKITAIATALAPVWQGLLNFVSMIWELIKVKIKDSINWVIDRVNTFINNINRMIGAINGVGKSVPGWTNITFSVAPVGRLAQGGVVDSPISAMIGEAGREVVMPLENNTEWITELADKINGSKGQGQNIVIHLGDEKIYQKFIDYVNDKSQASNSLIFNV